MSTHWDTKEMPQQQGIPVLGYDEALRLLDRAVEEKGSDYVDPNARARSTCEYFTTDGAPACIVGHVLSYLGITRADLWGHETTEVMDVAAELRRTGRLSIRSDTGGLLAAAQRLQDLGHPWGRAVATAVEEAEYVQFVTDEDV